MTQPAAAGALSPYRVLDLTTQRSWLTGKLLADLGATVTKVEPPGGDPGRLRGPYAGNRASPETSLEWWAYNRGKRSVTLDAGTADGRDLLLKLASQADAVLESFRPGQLEDWGLGYAALAGASPRLVLTRVTPFGQDGPYARFAASDLILAALGGAAWMAGDTDRAPVRISTPQYFLHAAAEAAVHTCAALYHAAVTGQGQQVDVSAQLATVRTLMNAVPHPHTDGQVLQRSTFGAPSPAVPYRSVYRCADGYVMASVTFGPGLAGYLAWLRAEGAELPGFLADLADPGPNPADGQPPEFPGRVCDVLAAFFAGRGKQQLAEQALAYRLMLVPINTLADIAADPQLAERGYFRAVEHEGREPVAYPTTWVHLSATPLAATSRAPSVGADNAAVWLGEAGLTEGELRAYQLAGTI
ncbi:MAG TPA: CoA transferase [Streptosporangiaceae bacterium]|jgi:crotonobetainyl-CoA:carnitine CoA-transferase CaiB-like acyl-CoA transferase